MEYKFDIKKIKEVGKIVKEDREQKVIENPDGSVRVIQKQKNKKADEKNWWIRIPKNWWRVALKGLTPHERCILITLRLYANREGYCYPSLRTISSDLNISINTTRKYLKDLEKKKYIKIIATKKGYWNKWTYFLYQI